MYYRAEFPSNPCAELAEVALENDILDTQLASDLHMGGIVTSCRNDYWQRPGCRGFPNATQKFDPVETREVDIQEDQFHTGRGRDPGLDQRERLDAVARLKHFDIKTRKPDRNRSQLRVALIVLDHEYS